MIDGKRPLITRHYFVSATLHSLIIAAVDDGVDDWSGSKGSSLYTKTDSGQIETVSDDEWRLVSHGTGGGGGGGGGGGY